MYETAMAVDQAQDPRMSLRNILHNGDAILTPPVDRTMYDRSLSSSRPRSASGASLAYAQSYNRRPSAPFAPRACGSPPLLSPASDCGGGGGGILLRERWDMWQVRTASSAYSHSGIDRKPRPPRPSYSEEQKFYIMYCRVMLNQTWPEIEDAFTNTFGGRTKGGLTSIYYRVRKDWGLCEALKSGPQSNQEDCTAVKTRAHNFSREFLSQIGYLDRVGGM